MCFKISPDYSVLWTVCERRYSLSHATCFDLSVNGAQIHHMHIKKHTLQLRAIMWHVCHRGLIRSTDIFFLWCLCFSMCVLGVVEFRELLMLRGKWAASGECRCAHIETTPQNRTTNKKTHMWRYVISDQLLGRRGWRDETWNKANGNTGQKEEHERQKETLSSWKLLSHLFPAVTKKLPSDASKYQTVFYVTKQKYHNLPRSNHITQYISQLFP